MRKAPLVIAGTVAGIAGVLTFHTSAPSSVALAPTSSASSSQTRGTASTGKTGGPKGGGATAAGGSGATTSATGSLVPYGYGQLAVKVTAKGGRIESISIPTLQVADQYSGQIASQVIPMLNSEVLSAQSAQINSVSGATYTAQAYVTSLQAALDSLHIK